MQVVQAEFPHLPLHFGELARRVDVVQHHSIMHFDRLNAVHQEKIPKGLLIRASKPVPEMVGASHRVPSLVYVSGDERSVMKRHE